MKKIIYLTLTLLFVAGLGNSMLFAQKSDDKTGKAEIQTSAICGMCKERIEKYMAFEKGVKSVALNDSTKILHIEYNINKTDKEKLKKAVTKIGYDADDLVADEKAYNRLPACCKKDNAPH